MSLDPHKILLHPYVTEKAMDHMTGRIITIPKAMGGTEDVAVRDFTPRNPREHKRIRRLDKGNKLEFVVHRKANKYQIKQAFEEYFKVKVASVNTRHCKDGKHAVIKLESNYSAEEIGMNIGIF